MKKQNEFFLMDIQNLREFGVKAQLIPMKFNSNSSIHLEIIKMKKKKTTPVPRKTIEKL